MREAEQLLAKSGRFLSSADALLGLGDLDSAVSRAYYAMFYAAQAALLTKGLPSSSHGGVVSAFGEHFVKSGVFPREIGRALHRAQEMRQLADYDPEASIAPDEAGDLLRQARDFVDRVEAWLRSEGHIR